MKSPREFLNVVGRPEFEAETGISSQRVTNAIRAGKFPSGWWPMVRDFCERRGRDVPEHLFRWTTDTHVKSSPSASSTSREAS